MDRKGFIVRWIMIIVIVLLIGGFVYFKYFGLDDSRKIVKNELKDNSYGEISILGRNGQNVWISLVKIKENIYIKS